MYLRYLYYYYLGSTPARDLNDSLNKEETKELLQVDNPNLNSTVGENIIATSKCEIILVTL